LLERITAFLVASGPWAILAVAFIDSVGIPLTVGLDLLVVLLSTKRPELAVLWAGLAVLGSTAGNLSLFFIARKSGGLLLKKESTEGFRARFREWFHRFGLTTLFIPAIVPFPPMPMKFFVVCAGCLNTPVSHFLFTVILARTLRYGVEAYLGAQIGDWPLFLKTHRWDFAMATVLLAIGLYLMVRLSERLRSAR
jgi:membrane protein YqaA with SNARE-associated domain